MARVTFTVGGKPVRVLGLEDDDARALVYSLSAEFRQGRGVMFSFRDYQSGTEKHPLVAVWLDPSCGVDIRFDASLSLDRAMPASKTRFDNQLSDKGMLRVEMLQDADLAKAAIA